MCVQYSVLSMPYGQMSRTRQKKGSVNMMGSAQICTQTHLSVAAHDHQPLAHHITWILIHIDSNNAVFVAYHL